jgi:hypothetical protein
MARLTATRVTHNCVSYMIDIAVKIHKGRVIPRGASNDAEMAVSRTLEPDPGHAGVGTEKAPRFAPYLFSASPGSP